MILTKFFSKRKIIKIFIFLFLSMFLFSCNSFASQEDKARVMYAYDSAFEENYFLNGTTKYGVLNDDNEVKNKKAILINKDKKFYKWHDCKASKLLEEIKQKAINDKIIVPNDEYWFFLDDLLLKEVLAREKISEENVDKYKECLQKFGYIKYFNNFEKFNEWNLLILKKHGIELGTDFEKLYKEIIQKKVDNTSSYISLKKDTLYGNFGFDNKNKIYLEPKNWNSTKFSSFDFVFVYPIAYLIEKITFKFGNNGFSKILSIFIIILIIRSIAMLLFSVKAGVSQQKIKNLQSELEKIKEKFSDYESQLQKKFFYQEQKKLFQKNNISMFCVFIDFIFKFFSFIFITSAIKSSAILATDSFFNLFFNKSIKNAVFQKPGIANGWLTGFIIFIIMVLAQILSMKISGLFQKKISGKQKKVITIQENKNFVPFIIFSIITIVGFFLSINISIYIICTSLLDILQTLIVSLIVLKQMKKSS